MSYNVLCDGCDSVETCKHATQEVLDFWFRAPRIISEIRESKADIICFQELNHVGTKGETMKPFYKAELNKLGFELICYKPADYFTEDRIAIAVRKSAFKVLDT